ncbi:hypothetical protein J2T57_001709 [Natronocella acetinitrilica]|uniref:Uncharacterized protein n=1 Tax=Natronocella acetinitrilica TaxID=414046 RepID=A0AAE3G660_9GAMM|nr:hypothetical protein [Natronocella acetinitrilica]MCP1674607.1 hypothetical protein [Natronocella acetinitrilica]
MAERNYIRPQSVIDRLQEFPLPPAKLSINHDANLIATRVIDAAHGALCAHYLRDGEVAGEAVEALIESTWERECQQLRAAPGWSAARAGLLRAALGLHVSRRLEGICADADRRLDLLQREAPTALGEIRRDFLALSAYAFGEAGWADEIRARPERYLHPDCHDAPPGSAEEAVVLGSWIAQATRLVHEGYLPTGDINPCDPLGAADEPEPVRHYLRHTQASVLRMLGSHFETTPERRAMDHLRLGIHGLRAVTSAVTGNAAVVTLARELRAGQEAALMQLVERRYQRIAQAMGTDEPYARANSAAFIAEIERAVPGEPQALAQARIAARRYPAELTLEQGARYLAVLHPEVAARLDERLAAYREKVPQVAFPRSAAGAQPAPGQ